MGGEGEYLMNILPSMSLDEFMMNLIMTSHRDGIDMVVW